MKTYYGQMTKEQLLKTKIKLKDSNHNLAFQGMAYRAGCEWLLSYNGAYNDKVYLVIDGSGHLGYGTSEDWFSKLENKQINWLPESERPTTSLKSQLTKAITKREKCKAKVQNAVDKLEQAEKEVQRLIAETEKDIEAIGGISCKISETTKPDIPEGVDVDDPKTWQAGDIVECVFTKDTDAWTKGVEYEFYALDSEGDPRVSDNTKTPANSDYSRYVRFRFVRRP